MKKVVICFGLLILFTPLGLLAPGTAWGEWGLDEIRRKIGFIPQGMGHYNKGIKNLLPDYGTPGFDKNFSQSALGYIVSAIIGISAIVLIFGLVAKLTTKKQSNS